MLRFNPLILLAFVMLLPACPAEDIEGNQPGECSDGADNDSDGYFDCNDSNCYGAPDCLGDDDDDDASSDDDDTSSDDDDASSDDDDTKLDDTKLYEWQDFSTIFDMLEQKDANCPLFELKSERPEAGHHYLFRIFLYDKSTGVMSPPSRRSATISLMEDGEE